MKTSITPMKFCCSYRCAVTQHQCTAALALAKCIHHCPVLLCKPGSQHACVTAMTPMKVCCSYRCAVTQHPCTAALALAKCIHHCPVLLCTTGSQHAYVTAITPIKVCCSYRCAVTPTPMHCSTGFGKMHSPLSSAALQNRLTACLCYCNDTYEGLLLIKVCRDPTLMHCSTGFGKMHSPLSSAALQAHSMLVSLQSHL